jgi:hypothetical protein
MTSFTKLASVNHFFLRACSAHKINRAVPQNKFRVGERRRRIDEHFQVCRMIMLRLRARFSKRKDASGQQVGHCMPLPPFTYRFASFGRHKMARHVVCDSKLFVSVRFHRPHVFQINCNSANITILTVLFHHEPLNARGGKTEYQWFHGNDEK